MSKQIILVKGVSINEFDYISEAVKEKLESGETNFCVYSSGLEAEIDIIEIPEETDQIPTTIHNTYMGMQSTELKTIIHQVVLEILKELNPGDSKSGR